MNNMYIDYDKSKVIGSKLQEEASVLKQLLDKLYEINEKLEDNVKDEILEEYCKSLLANTKVVYKLVELASSTGSTLTNISSAYCQVEKNGINSEVKSIEE